MNKPVAYRWKSDLGYIYDIYDHGGGEPLYCHPSEHDLGIAEAIGFDKGYQTATARSQETDCYGDGTVYRGVRSKDSQVKTYVFDEHAGKQTWSNPANTPTEIIEKNKPEIEKVNAYMKSLEDKIEELKANTLTDEEFDRIFANGKRLGVLETEDRFRKAMNPTDEEILEVAKEMGWRGALGFLIRFARAVLKKASEG
jgi:hypothetical protein